MSLFHQLDAEWRQLTTLRSSAAALRRWAKLDPALGAYDSLEALGTALRDRDGLPYGERDATLGSVMALAPTEDLAGRVVLQSILHSLFATAEANPGRRFGREDVDAEVIAVAWEQIHTYSLARRPHHVAANLVLDIRKVLRARGYDRAAQLLAQRVAGERPRSDGDAAAELVELLAEGLRCGVIDAFEASLIARTRIGDEPIDGIAAELSLRPQSVRRRRSRAERSLAGLPR